MSDEALRELQRQTAKLLEGLKKELGDKPALTFGEYARQHTATKMLNPTLRSSTKKNFEGQVRRHLLPGFGAMPLDKINNAEWLKWVAATRELGKITRFFNPRKDLVEILTAAREEGHIERVPSLDNPDEKRKTGRVLEKSEIARILWRARRPHRFIFFVFYRMGIRPREILKWEWSFIDWNEPGKTWLNVPARISKTDRKRRIALCPRVSRHLYARHKRGNGSRFVFPMKKDLRRPQLTYHSSWERACRLGGVTDAVAYDFRRTWITEKAAEGKSTLFMAKQLDTSEKMIESTYLKDDVGAMEGLFK